MDRHCWKCLTYSETRREAAALRRGVPNAYGQFRHSLYHHQLPVAGGATSKANGNTSRSRGPHSARTTNGMHPASNTASVPLIDYNRHGHGQGQSSLAATLSAGSRGYQRASVHSQDRPSGRLILTNSGHHSMMSMPTTQRTPQSSPSIL